MENDPLNQINGCKFYIETQINNIQCDLLMVNVENPNN